MSEEKLELAPKEEQKTIQVEELERPKEIKGERIFLSSIDDDVGFLKVVSEIPTKPPKNSFQKIKIYLSGETRRLYVWDGKNWRFVNLT